MQLLGYHELVFLLLSLLLAYEALTKLNSTYLVLMFLMDELESNLTKVF